MEAAGQESHVPILIWPAQGRYALSSSLLALGALREAGLPVELFYEMAGGSSTSEILHSILKAVRAYSRLHSSRIGVIGGLFPNLVSCRYDPLTVQSKLGLTFTIVAGEDPLELLEKIKERVVTMHASDRFLEGGNIHDLRTMEKDPLYGYAHLIQHGVIGRGR